MVYPNSLEMLHLVTLINVCGFSKKKKKMLKGFRNGILSHHQSHCLLMLKMFFCLLESMLALPYHVPEPKTIDQFFKKRARPMGPAMALLK